MGSKTPVSILHEMLVRKGYPPQYDLIHNGGGTHEAIFKYKVYAGDVTALGSGRSKKEAKHDAAKNALELLARGQTSSPDPVPEDALDVTSPYKDKIQENAVGALHDFCITNDIPIPDYHLIGEEGPPHARQFTYLCSVSKQEENGMGRTKKQAKQLAAHKMLTRLKNSLSDILDMATEKKQNEKKGVSVKDKEAMSRYMEKVGTGRRVAIGQRLSDYHLALTYLPVDEIRATHARLMESESNAEDLLVLLVSKMQIHHSFQPVLNRKSQHMAILSLSTTPESVVVGQGESVETAKQNAAAEAIKYLHVMIRKTEVDKQEDISFFGNDIVNNGENPI